MFFVAVSAIWDAISFRRSMPARCACMCVRRPERGLKKHRRILQTSKPPSVRLSADNQIDVILDNIGLPYSGINIALSDSATIGPMDGEILISLNKNIRRRRT